MEREVEHRLGLPVGMAQESLGAEDALVLPMGVDAVDQLRLPAGLGQVRVVDN